MDEETEQILDVEDNLLPVSGVGNQILDVEDNLLPVSGVGKQILDVEDNLLGVSGVGELSPFPTHLLSDAVPAAAST